jgi:hypothetical protein
MDVVHILTFTGREGAYMGSGSKGSPEILLLRRRSQRRRNLISSYFGHGNGKRSGEQIPAESSREYISAVRPSVGHPEVVVPAQRVELALARAASADFTTFQ